MIRFDEFMDRALYAQPGGFFADGGGAGRGGADFVTSAEVGPLFGAVVARYLDSRWAQLGEPEDFHVVEAAAGRGALAIAVLAAEPRCARALRYTLVERSDSLRARQREHLSITTDAAVEPGSAPLTQCSDLPRTLAGAGVVIANELLDNIAFRLLQRRSDGQGWDEVWVRGDTNGGLEEELLSADPAAAALADRFVADCEPGRRIPLQIGAADWLSRALGVLGRGSLVALDYGATTPELAARPWTDWVRTYRQHQRGGHPLDLPGNQDITCEVAWDQLGARYQPARHSSQRDWLVEHGIDELVEAGRQRWEAKAHAPDLDAVAGRSRAIEAEALCDPAGLGAFDVVEWTF